MQRHPSPIPAGARDLYGVPDYGERLAEEFLASVPSCPECSPLPVTTRLAFGAISVVLMCAAAMASSAIITWAPPGRPPTVSSQPIQGALALRPDLLREAQWPFMAHGGFAPAPAPASGAVSEPSALLPAAPQHSRHAFASANPGAGSPKLAIAVVRDFYARLATDPARALELVSADLLGGRPAEVARAWEDAASLSPRHIDARPDGSVVTDVEAEYPDGSRMVLRQLLVVELGSAPKIVGAELLSARHIDPQ